MNRILALTLLIPCILPVALQATETEHSNNEYCYSAYHLQQHLDLAVNYGKSVQRQKTKVDVDIHVREIPVRNSYAHLGYGKDDRSRNIRSFVALVKPNTSKVNGVEVEMTTRYQHPFVVWVDGDSGELIELKSTVKEQPVLNEYLSFFDLFQYSERNGDYRYRNGNGQYQASINYTDKKSGQLSKKNMGYLKTDENNNSRMKLQQSYLSMTLNKSESECFYQKGEGAEVFKTSLSANAFVNGKAKLAIESDLQRALPLKHYFYTLTDDLATWPGFAKAEPMSREEALIKLPVLMTRLSLLTEDDSQFLQAMLVEKGTWKYLAEYILENGLSNELSIQLFWALDKINTTESVSALATLATSPLSEQDHFRAVMALGSTSAPFDEDSVALLQNHMSNFTNPEFAQPENLTFVRMLGAMASKRNTTDPLQSSEIRHFLYSQSGGYEDKVNAAVIDAIGNLKDSIDLEGEEILFQGLSDTSVKVRQSAASAFSRVPYKAENSSTFVDQLSQESNLEIKNTIVDVLARASNTDLVVKKKLLSILPDQNLKSKSLSSLKKIGYDYQADEIQLLESRLRQETDKEDQRLLASLILKHRSKQKH